jgi:GH43 family beta-xylosidase
LTDSKSWKKSKTPVFVKNPEGQAFGPGHNGFFKSADGKEDWIIYHANPKTGQGCGGSRSARIQKISWRSDGTPDFGKPVPLTEEIAGPAGE